MTSWAVCSVETNREKSCHIDFERMCINSYVPLGTRLTKPKNKKKPIKTTYCPFPGYIFADFAAASSFDCKQARGFVSWLRSSEGVLIVRDQVVYNLRLMQHNGNFDIENDAKKQINFEKDEFVKIISGPFAGMNGIVIDPNQGDYWIWINVVLDGLYVKVKLMVDFVRRIEAFY